ncbi:MAG: hypothetical protein ACRYGO_08020 [Janthinobacterium lividum]
MVRRRRAVLALGLACLLAGCKMAYSAAGLAPAPATPDRKTLTLRAEHDANAGSPVALDIVFVRDAAVLDTLAAMPASEWFPGRADMLRRFPETLTVWSVELLPGQVIEAPGELWRNAAGSGALVFANYASRGEHRIRLALDTRSYLIRLGAEEVGAIELNHQDHD